MHPALAAFLAAAALTAFAIAAAPAIRDWARKRRTR